VKHGNPCLPARFWARVEQDPITGLWTWTGRVNHKGYGTYGGTLAHRALFLASGQELPQGWHVGHTCHDEAVRAGTCQGGPACEHRRCLSLCCLEAQSPRANTRAGLAPAAHQARQETAACGHSFTDTDASGRWYCRPCRLAKGRERTKVITLAARAIGMTHWEFVAQHGASEVKAREILASP
jgi:hypothetical protein